MKVNQGWRDETEDIARACLPLRTAPYTTPSIPTEPRTPQYQSRPPYDGKQRVPPRSVMENRFLVVI